MVRHKIINLNIRNIEIEVINGSTSKFDLRTFTLNDRNIVVLIQDLNHDGTVITKSIPQCVQYVYKKYLKGIPEDQLEFFECIPLSRHIENSNSVLDRVTFNDRKRFLGFQWTNVKEPQEIFKVLGL